jgi:hypothetical protein
VSLDAETIALRARERFTEASEEEAPTLPRLISLVPDAMKKLARMVAGGENLLTKPYELTAEAGVAPLADALNDGEPLLIDFISRGRVLIDGFDSPLMPVADRGFQQLEDDGRASYSVEDEALNVKGPDGWYGGPVHLKGMPCVPSFDRIERQRLDEKLVDIVAAMAAPPVKRPGRAPAPTKG